MLKFLIVMIGFITAVSSFANEKTICGKTDDRSLSFEAPVGRLSVMDKNYGCTVTMIGNSCAITAGHCKSVLVKAEFNTPISEDGEAKPAQREDTYLIDQDSIVSIDKGQGNDWAVLKIQANELTRKLPGQVQGFYNIKYDKVQVGAMLRITGYGYDYDDKDRNFAQQTHTGQLVFSSSSKIMYKVDTTGGNSGSTIRLNSTNEIIGVHTHGGCFTNGGSNAGTAIAGNSELVSAIRNCLATQ